MACAARRSYNGTKARRPDSNGHTGVIHMVKENVMPWYAWLILLVAIGSIVGGLMILRDTAKKLPLTDEQLRKVRKRNAEANAKDAQDR